MVNMISCQSLRPNSALVLVASPRDIVKISLLNGSNFGSQIRTQEKVMFLSEPDDDETIKLKQKIINDQKAKSGKNVAFVMGQRYVTMESLKMASKTSELK